MDSTWSSSAHWGTFWGQLQIELIGGTISAFIFLFIVLWLFKPKIKIAPFLCKETTSAGNVFYVFKFINKSFFPAHDIKVELHQLRKIPMGNGNFNNEYMKLTLVNSVISHISARTTIFRKDKGHPHCVTIRSTEDINTILTEELHAILLKISLKHGLTGLSNVFEQEYANLEDIKSGKFKPGTKFATI